MKRDSIWRKRQLKRRRRPRRRCTDRRKSRQGHAAAGMRFPGMRFAGCSSRNVLLLVRLCIGPYFAVARRPRRDRLSCAASPSAECGSLFYEKRMAGCTPTLARKCLSSAYSSVNSVLNFGLYGSDSYRSNSLMLGFAPRVSGLAILTSNLA